MKRIFVSLLMVLGVGFLMPATSNAAGMPGQLCTATGATDGNCGLGVADTNGIYLVTDGVLATGACTGGTDTGVCLCQGVTCLMVASDATGGIGEVGNAILFMGEGESIDNDTNGTFELISNVNGTIILVGGDSTDDNTPFTINSAGTGALTLAPEGAALIQLGGALTTEINAYSDSDWNFINSSSNSVALHLRDYGDTADDDMAHVSLLGNCTNVATGTEDCDFQINTVEAGVVETRVLVDGDGGIDLSGGDVILNTIADGGNAGAANEFIGLPRISMAALGAMGNGPILSEPVTPTVALCAPVGGGAEADSATIYRDTVTDVTSYAHTFVAVVGAGEGFDCDVTGHAVVGTTSVGFWLRSSVAFADGDLEINLLDGAAVEGDGNLPAYTTPNVWQWMEVDVTADCAATCAGIDGVELLTTAANPTDFNNAIVYMDSGAFWLAACEETLGANIPYDGVLSILAGVTAGGNTALLAEGTDYIVHYQTGNDAVCMITNQSANYGMALYAY